MKLTQLATFGTPRPATPKPSRTARRIQATKDQRAIERREDAEKAKVRRRDRACRFPLCGCRKLGLALKARLEVSHHNHKGMGGNRLGDRSVCELMVLLCGHRHQDGAISRHKGTLRAHFLTRHLYDGPVAWAVRIGRTWVEVARESAPGTLEPLTNAQRELVENLAKMER